MELFTQKIYTQSGLAEENPLPGRKVLDVGCGSRKLPGAVGIDRVRTSAADIVHDMEIFPWPLKDDEFDVVFLNHSLEHMENLLKTISEIHRIAKKGGRIIIQVPYFRSVDAFSDPTHRHFFTAHSLDYFLQGEGRASYNYVPVRFQKLGFWYGWPGAPKNSLRRLMKYVIHRHPDFYDQYLSIIFPLPCLTWELEVLK